MGSGSHLRNLNKTSMKIRGSTNEKEKRNVTLQNSNDKTDDFGVRGSTMKKKNAILQRLAEAKRLRRQKRRFDGKKETQLATMRGQGQNSKNGNSMLHDGKKRNATLLWWHEVNDSKCQRQREPRRRREKTKRRKTVDTYSSVATSMMPVCSAGLRLRGVGVPTKDGGHPLRIERHFRLAGSGCCVCRRAPMGKAAAAAVERAGEVERLEKGIDDIRSVDPLIADDGIGLGFWLLGPLCHHCHRTTAETGGRKKIEQLS